MKPTNKPGVPFHLSGSTTQLLWFTVGLLLAIGGAYLFLTGFAIMANQELMSGLLNTLVGFFFISCGWRIVSSRILSHPA